MTTIDRPAASRQRRYGLSWVLAVSALEVLSLLLGAGPPFQPALSIIFVATCPGFLLLELDHPADRVAKIVLGIASSLSVNMLIVSVALVGDRSWIVPAIIATLAGLAFLPRYQLRAVVGDLSADTSQQAVLVDLNHAPLDQIATLPSVNRTVAQAIVDFRQSHGPFTHFDQLLEVRGVGPARLAAIQSSATLMRSHDDDTREES